MGLKPENSIYCASNFPADFKFFSLVDERWKIADFGCIAEGFPAASEASKRTPEYRAPEQIQRLRNPDGYSDKKADIWAFGCIAYELFTGQPAFSGRTSVSSYKNTEPLLSKTIFDFTQFPPKRVPSVQLLRSLPEFPVALTRAIQTKCVEEPLRLSGGSRPIALDLLDILSDESRLERVALEVLGAARPDEEFIPSAALDLVYPVEVMEILQEYADKINPLLQQPDINGLVLSGFDVLSPGVNCLPRVDESFFTDTT